MATAYEDPPECPECGKRMKHLRLEVLEREHSEFYERWHEHRRAIEAMVRVLGPAAPACEGCATEIAEALMIARKLGYGDTATEGHNVLDHRLDASNACGQSGGSDGSAYPPSSGD